jgi:hypothetical protein
LIGGGLLPESLTRKKIPPNLSTGGRLQIGMVAGFSPEPWPASRRNTRPASVGIRNLDTQDNTAMTGRDGAIDHVAKLELVAHEFERASEE